MGGKTQKKKKMERTPGGRAVKIGKRGIHETINRRVKFHFNEGEGKWGSNQKENAGKSRAKKGKGAVSKGLQTNRPGFLRSY